MSHQTRKAVICSGGCLSSIVVDKFRELTDVTVTLAANDQLSDDQLAEVIALYTRYENEVERRTEADEQALVVLKGILDL